VQDPSYPVYVDTTVMSGNTGEYDPDTSGFDGLQYMICNPDNDFFPDLSKIGKTGVTLQLLRYPIT
jgi:LL-diaminopimelate aminotransferase